jgi:hypothetical protein
MPRLVDPRSIVELLGRNWKGVQRPSKICDPYLMKPGNIVGAAVETPFVSVTVGFSQLAQEISLHIFLGMFSFPL